MSSNAPPPVLRKRLLTVVAPACNEEELVAPFCARVFAELEKRPAWRTEILIVDDGSSDATAEIVRRLRAENPRIGLLSFSRNFGHEAALLAGLEHARGDAVVTMDSDLQHPPEVIPQMPDLLDAGFDIVNGRRSRADAETFAKKWTARVWYAVLPILSRGDPTPPADVANFRLASRRAVDAFLKLRERGRYARGLFAWIGFSAAEVEYRRAPRATGKTKYTLWRMIGLALDGLTSFSTAPLRWSVYLGLLTLLLSGGYLVYALFAALILGGAVSGWASILASVLFLSGVQLVMLGVIGEYLAGVFSESKRRPHYIAREFLPAAGEQGGDADNGGE